MANVLLKQETIKRNILRYANISYFGIFARSFNENKNLIPKYNVINIENEEQESVDLKDVVCYIKDSRISYNCLINKYQPNMPSYMENKISSMILKKRKIETYKKSIPLIVEQLIDDSDTSNTTSDTSINITNDAHFLAHENEQFPFSKYENLTIMENSDKSNETLDCNISNDKISVKEDISVRLKAYNEKKPFQKSYSQVLPTDEELDFRIYDDTLLTDLTSENVEDSNATDYYGKPDPKVPMSTIPCGGCGAVLHCQDEGLPGYIPSEEFCTKSKGDLRRTLCQRCFFLKRYKTALNVRISPEIYEKALSPIANSRALVVVVLDLLDVPCSVWPGLFELIGNKRPVVVVGNKIDLIPLDNNNYVKTITTSLIESIKETSLWNTNICHVALVSAKTGFGVEDLITNIQIKWGAKGDIYIIGCTNAGKSSLFNALLGSDMCKIKATNLIRRATASPWPGTTLNLLRFPLMRPSGKRLFDRMHRIEYDKKKKEVEDSFSPFQNDSKRRIPTLTGHIGQTYHLLREEMYDPFSINAHKIPKETAPSFGINEDEKDYVDGRWCFDTPGTVQPDQFLGLLTHEELLDALPRTIIEPRGFSLKTSQSLFIGGLARIDVLYCPFPSLRVIVFCSPYLPITIVPTCEASSVYRTYLGSSLLHVPRGSVSRLEKWPALKPINLRMKCAGNSTAADIVLSSAGFISLIGKNNDEIDLRGWTPGGRGIHVRSVSMLPFANRLIGKRKSKTNQFYQRHVAIS